MIRPLPPFRRLPRYLAPRLLALGLLAVPASAEAPTEPTQVRFGYSRAMFHGVNEADFRSAMLTYSRVIAASSHLDTGSDQPIFDSAAAMATALREGTINLLAAPASEILNLPEDLLEPDFIVSTYSAGVGVEYVILTRTAGDSDRLARLRGRKLFVWNGPHTDLARPWLECLLAREQLGPASAFFGEIKPCPKPGAAVLPVFFGQTDAALVTRRAYTLLCELNPQMSRGLRIIATSPAVQPILTGFRRGMPRELRDKLTQAMFNINGTVAGRQVLTLYQTESVAYADAGTIATTRELLAEYARLSAPTAPMP